MVAVTFSGTSGVAALLTGTITLMVACVILVIALVIVVSLVVLIAPKGHPGPVVKSVSH